MRKTDNRCE